MLLVRVLISLNDMDYILDSSKIKSITYQTIMRPPDSDEGHLCGDEIPLKLDGTGEHLTEDFIEV